MFAEIPDPVAHSAATLVVFGEHLADQVDESHPLQARAVAASRLAMVTPASEHTPLNVLRRDAGGAIPQWEHDDPVVAAARWLGRDILPCYLLLEARWGGPDHDPAVVDLGRQTLFEHAGDAHPAIDAFEEVFERDERFAFLRELIATERQLPGTDMTVSGSVYLTGDAVPDQPLVYGRDLIRGLVEAAWDRQRLTGDADPVEALKRLPEILDELLRALGGEEIEVPACVGLRGLGLPEGMTLKVRRGTLRGSTLSEAHRIEDDPVDLVLELRLRAKITATLLLEGTRWGGWYRRPWPGLAEQAEAVSLGSALASELGHPPGVTVAWIAICGPFGQENVELSPDGRPEKIVQLDEDGAHELATWTALVRRRGSQLPAVARRRAIMALHERTLYADGLVDTVISLESIFGGGASLRLQAACAWLLAPDDYRRRHELFDAAEELYSLRSKTIHQGAPVRRTDWVEAVGVLREVLRTLLRDRPDLLSGGNIGDRLLLGEPASGSDSDVEPQHDDL